jgi:NitT/TauT family transport system substrate-binding protein
MPFGKLNRRDLPRCDRLRRRAFRAGDLIMSPLRIPSCLAAALLLALTSAAAADDVLRIAVARQDAWDAAAPRLGQAAGIFHKHGLALELHPYADIDASDLPAIFGSADIGLSVDLMAVLGAYSKGAPLRIIGAGTTGSPSYWYVQATSPIRRVKDLAGRTVAYSPAAETGRYDVFDLMNQYRIKPKLMPAAGEAAAFKDVMAGQIDVGWATPPFGLEALEQGRARVVARANDVAAIRDRTVRVIITDASRLQSRRDALARFMQAYRETVAWMYSDATVPKQYAEVAGLSEDVARRLRDGFFTPDMLRTGEVRGLKATLKDAARLHQILAPLSRRQVNELLQAEAVSEASVRSGWLPFLRR